MSLKDLYLKEEYSSDIDNILFDFYVPALSKAISYDRIAGEFTSYSLAIASKGIMGLIRNGGRMRMVVAPKFLPEDYAAMEEAVKNPEQYTTERMLTALDRLEEEIVAQHVQALGWLIANGRLEIKVAIPTAEAVRTKKYPGIFHQKVGILRDSVGDIVTFSGGLNETAGGWLNNIEEFKVFWSWGDNQWGWINPDLNKFDRFWDDNSPAVNVYDLPDAVKRKLIEISPSDLEQIHLDKLYEDLQEKVAKKTLFRIQLDAIDAWVKNNMTGILEMATSTGKTITALGCIEKAILQHKRMAVVITAPFSHLLSQWQKEIEEFGLEFNESIIADTSNPKWRTQLTDAIKDVHLEHKDLLLILTTNKTFSNKDFREILINEKEVLTYLLIADEVHNLGSTKQRLGLIEEYDLRLGLSATPSRWFDDGGTKKLLEYFGGTVFKFDFHDAITTINPATRTTYLVPYRYSPIFTYLTDAEIDQYVEMTRSISKRYHSTKKQDAKDEILERLEFLRADIIRNASRKMGILQSLISSLPEPIAWTLIYCSPGQIDEVMAYIGTLDLKAHRFTQKEKTVPTKKYRGLSQRDYILKKFAERLYQVLVAMKCLDEGVNVPPARTAILMASTGNPREYIQRIGRVIRRFPEKEEATIHDIIVLPSMEKLPPDLASIESKIFEREYSRYKRIAELAINNAEALETIYSVKDKKR